jgi:hypothetical protein
MGLYEFGVTPDAPSAPWGTACASEVDVDYREKRRGMRIRGGIVDRCPECGELGLVQVLAKRISCTHETSTSGGVEYVDSRHTVHTGQLLDFLPATRRFIEPRLKADPEVFWQN